MSSSQKQHPKKIMNLHHPSPDQKQQPNNFNLKQQVFRHSDNKNNALTSSGASMVLMDSFPIPKAHLNSSHVPNILEHIGSTHGTIPLLKKQNLPFNANRAINFRTSSVAPGDIINRNQGQEYMTKVLMDNSTFHNVNTSAIKQLQQNPNTWNSPEEPIQFVTKQSPAPNTEQKPKFKFKVKPGDNSQNTTTQNLKAKFEIPPQKIGQHHKGSHQSKQTVYSHLLQGFQSPRKMSTQAPTPIQPSMNQTLQKPAQMQQQSVLFRDGEPNWNITKEKKDKQHYYTQDKTISQYQNALFDSREYSRDFQSLNQYGNPQMDAFQQKFEQMINHGTIDSESVSTKPTYHPNHREASSTQIQPSRVLPSPLMSKNSQHIQQLSHLYNKSELQKKADHKNKLANQNNLYMPSKEEILTQINKVTSAKINSQSMNSTANGNFDLWLMNQIQSNPNPVSTMTSNVYDAEIDKIKAGIAQAQQKEMTRNQALTEKLSKFGPEYTQQQHTQIMTGVLVNRFKGINKDALKGFSAGQQPLKGGYSRLPSQRGERSQRPLFDTLKEQDIQFKGRDLTSPNFGSEKDLNSPLAAQNYSANKQSHSNLHTLNNKSQVSLQYGTSQRSSRLHKNKNNGLSSTMKVKHKDDLGFKNFSTTEKHLLEINDLKKEITFKDYELKTLRDTLADQDNNMPMLASERGFHYHQKYTQLLEEFEKQNKVSAEQVKEIENLQNQILDLEHIKEMYDDQVCQLEGANLALQQLEIELNKKSNPMKDGSCQTDVTGNALNNLIQKMQRLQNTDKVNNVPEQAQEYTCFNFNDPLEYRCPSQQYESEQCKHENTDLIIDTNMHVIDPKELMNDPLEFRLQSQKCLSQKYKKIGIEGKSKQKHLARQILDLDDDLKLVYFDPNEVKNQQKNLHQNMMSTAQLKIDMKKEDNETDIDHILNQIEVKDTYFQSQNSNGAIKNNIQYERPTIVLKDKFHQKKQRPQVDTIYGRIGKYELIEDLGSSLFYKIKLANDVKNNCRVIIKLMRKDSNKETQIQIMNEVNAFKKIKFHKNILSVYENGIASYEKASGKDQEVLYVALEIAKGGQLLDSMATQGSFEEPLARYFFKGIVAGLKHMHMNGICHRNLRPENILLDHKYVTKISDFAVSAPSAGRDNKGFLKTKLQPSPYLAPEALQNKSYDGAKCDLFAAATILFIMVAAHPPFASAQPQDPFYRHISDDKPRNFWKTHEKNKIGGSSFFSEEFKDLIENMLKTDPAERLNVSQIIAHPWMQGHTLSREEVEKHLAPIQKTPKHLRISTVSKLHDAVDLKLQQALFKINSRRQSPKMSEYDQLQKSCQSSPFKQKLNTNFDQHANDIQQQINQANDQRQVKFWQDYIQASKCKNTNILLQLEALVRQANQELLLQQQVRKSVILPDSDTFTTVADFEQKFQEMRQVTKNDEGVTDKISQFFAQTVHYIVDTKQTQKYCNIINLAFTSEYGIEYQCDLHNGLFENLKSNIKRLQSERYPQSTCDFTEIYHLKQLQEKINEEKSYLETIKSKLLLTDLQQLLNSYTFGAQEMSSFKNGNSLQQALFVLNLGREHYHVFTTQLKGHYLEKNKSKQWFLSTEINDNFEEIKSNIDFFDQDGKNDFINSGSGWVHLTNILKCQITVNSVEEIWQAYHWLKTWSLCKSIISLVDCLQDEHYQSIKVCFNFNDTFIAEIQFTHGVESLNSQANKQLQDLGTSSTVFDFIKRILQIAANKADKNQLLFEEPQGQYDRTFDSDGKVVQ